MAGDCHASPSPLPPGFRFRPTDGELVAHYLTRKTADAAFTSAAIRDADIYAVEPWDLLPPLPPPPRQSAAAEERCGYFFCARRLRWPSGVRTSRATAAGYWKSTGRDKAVVVLDAAGGGGREVGVKKTLVFYRGRAPRGEKTSWVMHEYRLLHDGGAGDGVVSSSPTTATTLTGGARSEWVICRVFDRKTTTSGNNNGKDQHHLRPCDDHHLGSSPAPAFCDDGSGHARSSFTSANNAMAPRDHLININMGDGYEEELLMNYSSSAFHLPELLEYESFLFDL
uniref:NAC domain-containing protein n=1 Tax=Leersia perrieri TaxID=77586 RepID=A0A0D9XDN0_9ORYZ